VNTKRKDSVDLTVDNFKGNYVYYGVREFGMTAIMNGLTVHGGYRPTAARSWCSPTTRATRCASRRSCTRRLRSCTRHDSIGLGEDGPTHQPIDILHPYAPCRICICGALRCRRVGGCVDRGARAQEWPTALIFTRQGLPQQTRTPEQLVALRKGGYVLIDSNGPPEAIVIATGSEVGIAAEA